MSALVVFVHPLAESFGAAVFGQVARGLASVGTPFETIDLYADGFQSDTDLPDQHRKMLGRASTLVLVYPTWWTTQPAILLAWLAAVAANEAASVTSLVCVTTHGGSRLANLIAGRSGHHTAARVVRAHCARRCTFHWVAMYGLDKGDERRRVAFLERVEREIGRLAT
jgi:NAD(P)H dehydrogenase (quinone)